MSVIYIEWKYLCRKFKMIEVENIAYNINI